MLRLSARGSPLSSARRAARHTVSRCGGPTVPLHKENRCLPARRGWGAAFSSSRVTSARRQGDGAAGRCGSTRCGTRYPVSRYGGQTFPLHKENRSLPAQRGWGATLSSSRVTSARRQGDGAAGRCGSTRCGTRYPVSRYGGQTFPLHKENRSLPARREWGATLSSSRVTGSSKNSGPSKNSGYKQEQRARARTAATLAAHAQARTTWSSLASRPR